MGKSFTVSRAGQRSGLVRGYANEEAHYPSNQARLVLLEQFGALVEVHRYDEYPPFEASHVISGLLHQAIIEQAQRDIEYHGYVPISVLRHSAFPLAMSAAQ